MSVFVSNCSPGEVVIRAPQCEIEQLLAGLNQPGVTIQRLPKKPEPLGHPTFNWDSTDNSQASVAEFNRAVARSANNGKPTPIPQTNWDWSESANKSELVNN